MNQLSVGVYCFRRRVKAFAAQNFIHVVGFNLGVHLINGKWCNSSLMFHVAIH